MIRLHNFPRREIERDVAIVQFIRDKDPDYLIKDIWNIVCLYLFGGSKNLIVSVPFATLKHMNNWLHLPRVRYFSCFYGLEDNGEFSLKTPNQTVTVSGRYALSGADFFHCPLDFDAHNLNKRAVLKLSFDPQVRRNPVEKWFTWHWSGSKTFYSLEQANLSRTYRNMIPILHTKNGHLKVFHSGYNENTIRILPTDEFHDCSRSSYHQCLQVHPQDFSP